MSGIYIPGIEPPKDEVGAFKPIIMYVGADGKIRAECEGTHKVIVVPDHGDLIDRDALGIRDAEKRAYEAYQMEKHEFFIEEPLLEYKRGVSEGLIRASGIVRFAPTIIPTNKEGEG